LVRCAKRADPAALGIGGPIHVTNVDWLLITTAVAAVLVLAAGAFVLYVLLRYGRDIYRIFETKPLFLAPQVAPEPDGRAIEFYTKCGRKLVGTYLGHRAGQRKGVILFLHEFGANRWLCVPYVGYLRADGFDVFTFDFCNHGESDPIVGYEPLQWVTEHEVSDIEAALAYLQSRPDAPAAGIGVLGVSKGGSAAVAAAGRNRFIRAVVTDSAFPTHGTVTEYEMRWCGIYVHRKLIYENLPRAFWKALTWCVVRRMRWHRRAKYVSVERGLKRMSRQPLFMIHGARDNYINREIVQRFFALAREPKSLWVIEGAKHNGCLDKAGAEYRRRVGEFFTAHLADRADGPMQAERRAVDAAFVASASPGNGDRMSERQANEAPACGRSR
jgi:pimeloyl-ACP methyl ester carboxylesterase